jgi:hypothetical protein
MPVLLVNISAFFAETAQPMNLLTRTSSMKTKSSFHKLVTLAALCVGLSSPALFSANLIQNGSFESPVVPANTSVSYVSPTSWQGSGQFEIFNGAAQAPIYPGPEDGQQCVNVAGGGGGVGQGFLSQAFTVSSPGTYVLTWFDNTGNGGPGSTAPYSVTVFNGGGGTVANQDLNLSGNGIPGWVQRSMTLNLSTGTYTLQFRSRQGPYGLATMLDNVRLVGGSPQISVNHTSLSWGTLLSPTFPPITSQSITITNSGDGELDITSISISGLDASAFSADQPGPFSIAPGTSQTVNVMYYPSFLLEHDTATLDIVHNDPQAPNPLSVSLEGFVVERPLDVTASVAITRSGLRYDRASQAFVQNVTMRNISSSDITGPASLVLDNISANATLLGAHGVTGVVSPLGSPYVDLPLAFDEIFHSGQIVTLTLQFRDPTMQGITYNTRVLAGTGAR